MASDLRGSNPDGARVEELAAIAENESISTNYDPGNNGGQVSDSQLNCFNKSSTQIKKPPRRSSSPLNWFPRKKTDSFLKRKLQHLQETEGTCSSLDETLGSANPHYTRIAREKIAAQEAAKKAMKARKAAMIEASWCRILHAARIHNKDAEEKLEKAEREVEEAFKEASLMGVMMYDRPDGPRRSCEIEKSSIIGGVSSHTIAASFETAFEVDKEVAMAVKIAFVRLARCPSSSKKDEFKDLIHKICENPEEFEFDRDIDPAAASPHGSMDVESKQNLVQLMSDSTFSSKDYKNELNSESNGNPVEPKLDQNLDKEECPYYSRTTDTESNQTLVHAVPDHFSTSNKEEFSELNDETKENPIGPKLDPNFDHIDLSFSESSNSESDQRLVNSMCYRPSSSAKEEIKKQNDDVSDFGLTDIEYKSNLVSVMYDRLSLLSEDEISSLAIIVATTGLNAALERTMGPSDPTTTNFLSRNHQAKKRKSGNDLPSLDKLLVKHVSKFEREVQEAKTSNRVESTVMKTTGDDLTCPDLGSILVKHVSKLEREIHSFRDSLKKQRVSGPDSDERNKVNLNMMDGEKMPLSHLPGKENLEPVNAEALESQSLPTVEDNRKSQRFEETQSKGLDQILVKHKSKLEKAKLDASDQHWSAPALDSKKKAQNLEMGPSLEQVLVKHQSNLEKSKPISMQNSTEQRVKSTSTWLEARNQKLREEWGGLSLANSLKPHLSRLERERAAWKRAEEEEMRSARGL